MQVGDGARHLAKFNTYIYFKDNQNTAMLMDRSAWALLGACEPVATILGVREE